MFALAGETRGRGGTALERFADALAGGREVRRQPLEQRGPTGVDGDRAADRIDPRFLVAAVGEREAGPEQQLVGLRSQLGGPAIERAGLDGLAAAHQLIALAGEADELMGEGRAGDAAARYVRASELARESDELLFWAGLAIAQNGDVAAGADAVRRAASVHPGWLTLLDRLSPEFAPAGAAVRRALAG